MQVVIGNQDQQVLAANGGIGGVNFIPFVVEMTGRFGPAAKSFLEVLQPGGSASKTYFRNLVSTNIAKINSMMQKSTNKKLRDSEGVANIVPDVADVFAELAVVAEARGADAAVAAAAANGVADVADELAIANGGRAIVGAEVTEADNEEVPIARRTRSHVSTRRSQHDTRLERGSESG